jgi:hypothetical protein
LAFTDFSHFCEYASMEMSSRKARILVFMAIWLRIY